MSGIRARLCSVPGTATPAAVKMTRFFNTGSGLPGGARMSFHSSGRSTPYCRFRHIRRTTSSPAFPLALEWNGRKDTVRSGPAGPSQASVEDTGVEDTVVVLRALTGLDSAAVAHKRRKSWTGGLPLLHSAGKRQSKVDSRRSPQSKPVDGVGNAAKVSGVCLTNGRRTEIAIPPGLKPTSFLRCFRHPSTSLRAG